MVIFFPPLTALFILVWSKKEHTIVCTVFANSQQGNHALIVHTKAWCGSYLSVLIAAPDGLIGKVLGSRRARDAAANRCLFNMRCSASDGLCWLCCYTQWVSVGALCSSAWASVLVLNFFHSIKRLFYSKAFHFLLLLSLWNGGRTAIYQQQPLFWSFRRLGNSVSPS